jgi:UDP-N-acetylmuramoylalanine--D-glutamate ligase
MARIKNRGTVLDHRHPPRNFKLANPEAPMIDIRNRHITIAGAARSGVAAAILLQKKGAIPFLSDAGAVQPAMADRLHQHGIEFEQNSHSKRALQSDMLVLSPGVPSDSPLPSAYLAEQKGVYSEIEIASWFNRSPVIAVTGSNGKTTVVQWMAHLWKTAGKKSILAGNIGYAFSEKVDVTAADTDLILEVSSFQLDHIDTFKPDVAVILNITPDHLDRYENSFEKYAASKFRIIENQSSDNVFIYNADDKTIAAFSEKVRRQADAPVMMAFSALSEVEEGLFVRNGQLIFRINHKEEVLMDVNDIALPGRHNLSNAMATALAARASEIKNEQIRESLETFEGVEHRLEPVRKLNGVKYINDSKATNINAVWYALDSFHVPVVLILGGRDKGNNYLDLEELIREKVHTVIAIGEAREKIRRELEGIAPNLTEADDMKEAVKLAYKSAKRGEIVLLSPACSSFDMFENYEERGNSFKQAVLEL